MDYYAWSDRLAAHFFRPEMAGRSVVYYVTPELLDELGAQDGANWRDFVSVVKAGHPWCPRHIQSVCQKALHCLVTWRNHNFDHPPHLPYLGLFVLAAGVDGDFAAHAYYPRLRELLGESGHGQYPFFDKMWQLWQDLERWANEDKHGDLGTFTARVSGGWVHVGMPLAQTLLTEHERALLPAIFGAAGLDPTSLPPDAELIRQLAANGGHSLRPRTLRLLENGTADELVAMLLDIVKEELAAWDGSVPAVDASGRETSAGNLRLCLSVDRIAAAGRAGLRCSMNREFPDDGLILHATGTDEEFICAAELLHWSTTITVAGAGPLNAARWSWDSRLELKEARFGWRFSLRAADVRVFVSGASEGLPNLVEVQHLPATGPFHLALSARARPIVESWAATGCTGFRDSRLAGGLPSGWSLYSATGLADGAPPCPAYPILSRATDARLILAGGLRAAWRNWYLAFALPDLVFEARHAPDHITCGGVTVPGDGPLFRLRDGMPAEQRLVAEATVDGQLVRSKPFYVLGDFTWHWVQPAVSFDRFGAPRDPSLPWGEAAAGARVPDGMPSRRTYSPHPSCFEKRRVFFLGRSPGQVVSWPADALPRDWQPVWAVPLERKGRAIFCGTTVADSEPLLLPSGDATDRRKQREWKEVLYYRQRRIDPPVSPAAARLWKRYQEVARRV